MRRTLAWILMVGVLAQAGCQADRQFSQTELAAIQTREFDAGFDAAFDATVNALFDAGYTVTASDKRGGFLAGSRTRGDAWRGFRFSRVQLKVDSAGAARSSVRISQTDGGQQSVDKQTIDELLNLIDRRLTGRLTGRLDGGDRPAGAGK
jgi:hypothetical protein